MCLLKFVGQRLDACRVERHRDRALLTVVDRALDQEPDDAHLRDVRPVNG